MTPEELRKAAEYVRDNDGDGIVSRVKFIEAAKRLATHVIGKPATEWKFALVTDPTEHQCQKPTWDAHKRLLAWTFGNRDIGLQVLDCVVLGDNGVSVRVPTASGLRPSLLVTHAGDRIEFYLNTLKVDHPFGVTIDQIAEATAA